MQLASPFPLFLRRRLTRRVRMHNLLSSFIENLTERNTLKPYPTIYGIRAPSFGVLTTLSLALGFLLQSEPLTESLVTEQQSWMVTC